MLRVLRSDAINRDVRPPANMEKEIIHTSRKSGVIIHGGERLYRWEHFLTFVLLPMEC